MGAGASKIDILDTTIQQRIEKISLSKHEKVKYETQVNHLMTTRGIGLVEAISEVEAEVTSLGNSQDSQDETEVYIERFESAPLMKIIPHHIYKDKEVNRGRHPIQLAHLANIHTKTLSPVARHNLTSADNASKIQELMKPSLTIAVEGYIGERNVDGEMHGKGKYTYANGDVYEGDWEEGYMNSNGKFTYANGDVYEGYWEEGYMHGKSRMAFANGNIYEGDWEKDKMHGKGRMAFADGNDYEGDYNEDYMHGKGKMIHADGEVYEGDWEYGELIGGYRGFTEHTIITTRSLA